jgi:hypothetical protein
MTWHEELSELLDRLRSGGSAVAGDWTLSYDRGPARYVLARHDGTVSLFGRDDLLAYASNEAGMFERRRWVLA